MPYEIPADLYPTSGERAPDAVSPLKLPQNRFDIDEAKRGKSIRYGTHGEKEWTLGPLAPEHLVQSHNREVKARGAGSEIVKLVTQQAAEYASKHQGHYENMARADMEADFKSRKAKAA